MLAERYDTFCIDLDGVVHLGDSVIDGVPAAIAELRDRGKTVRFVTNNSRSKRSTLVEKLAGFGIDAREAEIASSGWAAVEYVRERGIERVDAIATPEVEEMLDERGIALVEEDADAVLVGHDETMTYADVERAARSIYHRGAEFVAANADGWFPTADGIAPGTGAIVRAVEAASRVDATVVGKPEARLFESALEGLSPDDAVMVGDNPHADVVGAHRAGIDAVLVDRGSGDECPDGITPEATVSSLPDVFEAEPPES